MVFDVDAAYERYCDRLLDRYLAATDYGCRNCVHYHGSYCGRDEEEHDEDDCCDNWDSGRDYEVTL